MIFTCCFLQCKPCNSSMVFDRTGRKFIVQEKNYNLQQQQKKTKKYNNHKLQQQQKNSNNKLQKPKLKITKITTKIHNRKNYKPLFTGIITQLASLVLSLSLLPCMDTRSWSRLELGVQVSVPRPFQVPSRLTHTFPSS